MKVHPQSPNTLVYVVMVKRVDQMAYCSLEKTDGRFFLTLEEAQEAHREMGELKHNYHVVPILCHVPSNPLEFL